MAVPLGPHGRQGEVDRAGRGRLRRLGHRLPGRRGAAARLDAVRACAAVPARGGAAGGTALARRRARHLRLPRRPVEPVGDAVALPGRDRRGARPGARPPSRRSPTAIRRASRPTSGSRSTRRSSRATSSRTSASTPCAARGASSSRGSTWAACSRSPRGAAPMSCASCARRSSPSRCRRRGRNGHLVRRCLGRTIRTWLRGRDRSRQIEEDLNAALVYAHAARR